MAYHVGVDIHADSFEEIDQPDALDHLAAALVLEAVFGPEVDDLLGQFNDAPVVLVAVQFHERYHHGAHQVADLEGALAADQHGNALVVSGRQRLRHDVKAVHTLDAVAVVNFQFVVVGEGYAFSRAACDYIVDDVPASLFGDVFRDFCCVDFYVVPPTADDRKIGPLDGIGAIVRAAGYFEFELVGQRRAVDVVGEIVDQFTVQPVLVGAGLLAAGRTDA